MSAPILMNHDFTKAIGSVDVINGELHFRFATDVRITKDMAFEIFGNAGLQLFEVSEVDGVMLIRSGRIVEFRCLPAATGQRAARDGADAAGDGLGTAWRPAAGRLT
jgi:hypothetical protein